MNENMKTYKIAVAGTGYVGLSLSVLLAQHNQVMAVDIVQAKVDMINNHKFSGLVFQTLNWKMNYRYQCRGICRGQGNAKFLIFELDESRIMTEKNEHEAFYYYGLTDREPLVHTLTIYSGYNAHRLKEDGYKVYTVKKELLDVLAGYAE